MVSVVEQLKSNVCMSVFTSACQMDKGGAKRNRKKKTYRSDLAITDDYSSNDSSLHHQILSRIFRPQRWPHAKMRKKQPSHGSVSWLDSNSDTEKKKKVLPVCLMSLGLRPFLTFV